MEDFRPLMFAGSGIFLIPHLKRITSKSIHADGRAAVGVKIKSINIVRLNWLADISIASNGEHKWHELALYLTS